MVGKVVGGVRVVDDERRPKNSTRLITVNLAIGVTLWFKLNELLR